MRDNIDYYLMMLIPFVLIFLFSYLPMFGLVIAFQDYTVGRPFFGEGVKWVGIKHFAKFTGSFYFPRILRNTVVLNLMNLAMGFWVPIVFALVINEIPFSKFKKSIQTISYMPHFISSVVVAGMVISFIANDGFITKLINLLGFSVKSLNANANAFPWIYTLTNVWKSFGWGSILYLSSISSIDPTLYESADIDGAKRLQKIWYITLPFMLPLIIIQLILSIGGMFSSNTEMILLLYNSAVYKTADVIGTYVYRESLLGVKYSYGTASGLIMSVMSFILVYIANMVSRRVTDFSLW
ncbi:MAG: ABC transporter permease subunit [Christensenellales bacterium]